MGSMRSTNIEFLSENQKGGRHLRDAAMDVSIILKRILNKIWRYGLFSFRSEQGIVVAYFESHNEPLTSIKRVAHKENAF
jgi:hypothetical protein